MAMVIAGLASARENSAASVESPSVVVGSIPLVTTSCAQNFALLLHNAAKLVKLVWRRCCRRQEQADRRRRRRDSFY
jgi:hypothetical protein